MGLIWVFFITRIIRTVISFGPDYEVAYRKAYVLKPLKFYDNAIPLSGPPQRSQCEMKWKNLAGRDPVQCDSFELNVHPFINQDFKDCLLDDNTEVQVKKFHIYLKTDGLMTIETQFDRWHCESFIKYAVHGRKYERDGRLRDWRQYIDRQRTYFTARTSLTRIKCSNRFNYRLLWVSNENGTAFMSACSDEIENEYGYRIKLPYMRDNYVESMYSSFFRDTVQKDGARACPPQMIQVYMPPPGGTTQQFYFTNYPTRKPFTFPSLTATTNKAKMTVFGSGQGSVDGGDDNDETKGIAKVTKKIKLQTTPKAKVTVGDFHSTSMHGDDDNDRYLYRHETTTEKYRKNHHYDDDNANAGSKVATASTAITEMGPWIVIIFASISIVVISAGFAFTIYKLHIQTAIIVEAVATEVVPMALLDKGLSSKEAKSYRNKKKNKLLISQSQNEPSVLSVPLPQNVRSQERSPSFPKPSRSKQQVAPTKLKLIANNKKNTVSNTSKKGQKLTELAFKSELRQSDRHENTLEKTMGGNIDVNRSDKSLSAQVANNGEDSVTPKDDPSNPSY